MGLGIGIITYNRQEPLARCVEAVRRHTASPYTLLVADDGSTDGTRALLDDLRVEYLTGPNGGAGGNKNRALFALTHLTDCDPILLLEDDCLPVADGWEARWVEAAHRLHHCNVALPEWGAWFHEIQPPDADGTPARPYWWEGFTGQCTVSSRWALSQVGYMDPLFRGFGEEHVEWTRRFGRLLGWPQAEDRHGRFAWPRCETPMIAAPELSFPDAGTWFDAEETEANREVHALIKDGPAYRPPARTPAEKDALALSVGGLLLRRQGRVAPPAPASGGPNTFRLTLHTAGQSPDGGRP